MANEGLKPGHTSDCRMIDCNVPIRNSFMVRNRDDDRRDRSFEVRPECIFLKRRSSSHLREELGLGTDDDVLGERSRFCNGEAILTKTFDVPLNGFEHVALGGVAA